MRAEQYRDAIEISVCGDPESGQQGESWRLSTWRPDTAIPIKEALFTSRLICYNETFSTIMPTEKTMRMARKPLQKSTSACVLWHEALAGRSAEEVSAAYVLYLETICRDFQTVVIWADNCAAQNKCWALLSALMKVVHSTKTLTNRITIKYFEAGHTSMSADAVHQTISKNMRRAPVEDFGDFVKVTEASGAKVLVMSPGDNMVQVEDGFSRPRLAALANDGQRPYLANFRVVQVRRGTEDLLAKSELDSET